MKRKVDNPDLVNSTRISFASTFAFYLKAANFHWNVEGEDFYEYHLIFERIYNEVYDSIDTYAEFIRTIDGVTPAGLQLLSSLSGITDSTEPLTAMQMAEQLLADGIAILPILEDTYEKAEAAHEHGLSNFLAERLAAHKKHNWFLRASLK